MDFTYSGDNVWFRVIAEEMELTYALMERAIIENARSLDPNATITDSGFRTVNGINVYWAYLDVEMEGAKFTMYFHAYTGKEGSIQMVGWTTQNIFQRKIDIFNNVFSSFIIE